MGLFSDKKKRAGKIRQLKAVEGEKKPIPVMRQSANEELREEKKLEFKIPIRLEIAKLYTKQVVDGAIPGATLLRTYAARNGKDKVLELEVDYKSPQDLVTVAAKMEALKYSTAAQQKEVESKQSKAETEVIRLKFDSETANVMVAAYSDDLNIIQKVGTVNYTEIQFNISDCKGKGEVVSRIAKIFDTVQDIKEKRTEAANFKSMERIKNHLEKNCGEIKKQSEFLTEMTGAELIEKGYASLYDIFSYQTRWLNKLVNWLRGSSPAKYFFMGWEVKPDEKYVVRLRKPRRLPEPVTMNYEEEIMLHYNFGKQLRWGMGIDFVNQFQAEVIRSFNAELEAKKKAADLDGERG